MIDKGVYRLWSRSILAQSSKSDENTDAEPGTDWRGFLRQASSRISFWRIALLTLALLLPAIVNGSALPFPDSISYIKGGPVALEKLGALIDNLLPTNEAPHNEAATGNNLDGSTTNSGGAISGMRSATYSVYAYLMGMLADNGIFIVAGQAAMVAFTTVLFLRVFTPALSQTEFAATVVILTLLTSASWYGSFAMPDILGAAAVLSLALYYFYLEKLNLFEKLTIAAITAFAITAHPGNVLLVAALAGLGGIERLVRDIRAGNKFAFATYCWAGAPLALGVGAILAISLLGFGEASVAPKRYPYALARSVTDGPALWHLEKHCDTYHYAVCEVFDEIPQGVGEFLWEETGLRYKATPEQLDRIRAEEMTIVARAAREYPMAQIRKAFANTYEQITRIGIPAIGVGQKLHRGEYGAWRIIPAQTDTNYIIQPFETLQIVVVYASLGLLGYLLVGRKAGNEAALRAIALIGGALLVNAVICGVLSGPADRYQGRLIWLLPLIATALVAVNKPWKNGTQQGANRPST